jgi:cation:H+ antiporter
VSVGAAIPVFCACVAASLGASLVFGRKLDQVSERLGVSEGLHGILTALGADAPEISTAVAAIVSSHQEAGVGVVIGASTFNLAALLGVSALVAGSVAIHRHGLVLNGAAGLAVVGLGTALVLGAIGAVAATLLIAAVLVPYTVLLALPPGRVGGLLGAAAREEAEDMRTERARPATAVDALLLVPCLAVIVAASIWLVKAATTLGDHWNVSDVVLGTLVLASLTTLPNVVTAVRLALHGRGAAVVSEAFNSNSLNILAGLAIPAMFLSLGAASGVQAFSAWWLLGMTVVAIALAYSGHGLARVEGALLVLLYVPFVIVVATR